jgi:3-hydroxyisobutyrate dehydrogenase-like beta-hydroxyacid dehydrogenase
MTQTVSLALIGFGEVGKIFAREFLAGGGASVAIYDILLDDPVKGQPMRAFAAEIGARVAASAADAARDARIVISAVTADAVPKVAKDAAGYLHQGQIFFDVNSASPVTKKTAAGLVNAAHAKYVEGAVMAPVAGPGIKVPILGGGPAAAEVASILNPLGMKIDPVTTEPGRASAMKLCRSIVVKGLEAIMVDCAAAAKHWGVEDEVFASLNQSWPSIDFRDLAEYMGERVATHGIRRSAEMREAAMMVQDLGMNPGLAFAIADAQERGAKKK